MRDRESKKEWYDIERTTHRQTSNSTYNYTDTESTSTYTHRQSSFTHSHHWSSCGMKERVDIRCGSAECTGQKGNRAYPHNWVDRREDRHRSLRQAMDYHHFILLHLQAYSPPHSTSKRTYHWAYSCTCYLPQFLHVYLQANPQLQAHSHTTTTMSKPPGIQTPFLSEDYSTSTYAYASYRHTAPDHQIQATWQSSRLQGPLNSWIESSSGYRCCKRLSRNIKVEADQERSRSRHRHLAHSCTQRPYDYWFTGKLQSHLNLYIKAAAPHTNSGLHMLTLRMASPSEWYGQKACAKMIYSQRPNEFGEEAVKHYKECDSYQLAPITRLLFTAYSNSDKASYQRYGSTDKTMSRDGFLNNCTDIGDGFLKNCTDTADGLLWVQDKETGGDGLLNDHAGTSRTGVGYERSTHGRTDDVTDGHYPLPDADNPSKSPCMYRCEITSFWRGGCTTGVWRNCHLHSISPPYQWYSLPSSGHNQEVNTTIDNTACQVAAMTKKSILLLIIQPAKQRPWPRSQNYYWTQIMPSTTTSYNSHHPKPLWKWLYDYYLHLNWARLASYKHINFGMTCTPIDKLTI